MMEQDMNNYLRSALQRGEFFCSAELVLDRDRRVSEAETFVRDASREPRGIRVISLTDLPGGNPSLPPEAFASFVMDQGLTPLAHLTGKDGNRSFIEARLHSLARIGVENILALTGDAPKCAYLGKAKPVFDVDSVLMLRMIQSLREGLEYQIGKRLVRTSPFDFFPGAVVNPYKTREAGQMAQFLKLELKIAAGARFIITQLGFNLRKLFELKQYMTREMPRPVPLVANVYVPTATVARMMKEGELPGCVMPDALLRQLEGEKKPERLERAALMLAAVRDLGFAGGHIGGFGLTHADFMKLAERAGEIGADWKKRMDELVFETPGEFYLFPRGSDGLSDSNGALQLDTARPHLSLKQRFSGMVHRLIIEPGSFGAQFLGSRLKSERGAAPGPAEGKGFWHAAVGLSSLYRKAALGCMSCGDCIQDHLNYAGCTMRLCYKNMRNGPCGGSRVDGTCEANPAISCVWSQVYQNTLAAGDDPKRLACTLIPPRDWCLDQTNALTNRLTGQDNYSKRVTVGDAAHSVEPSGD
jgi:methylenetetrahydrofolate reductase (NADPH)